ncbi:MAG: nucleoside-diphosphate kinase [SAR324 cluster bacterium]|nr:nucleoside-diphosphate kinase [SAR324 cluster bacterium]
MPNTEMTLSIIKPDAVERNLIGKILTKLEVGGLEISSLKMLQLTKPEAEKFYDIHNDKPFFDELVKFMTRGKIVVIALKGEDAVIKNRNIMGATNPKEAQPGTIRHTFSKSIGENSVHGSDSLENAKKEISFFFGGATLI